MNNNIISLDEMREIISSKMEEINKYFDINLTLIDQTTDVYNKPILTTIHDVSSSYNIRVDLVSIPLEKFRATMEIPNSQQSHLNIFNIDKSLIISNLLHSLNIEINDKIFKLLEPYKIHTKSNKITNFIEKHKSFYKFLNKFLGFLSIQQKYDNYLKSILVKTINKHQFQRGTIIPSFNFLYTLLSLPDTKTNLDNNLNLITYKQHKIISPNLFNTGNIMGLYILPDNISLDIIIEYNPNLIETIETPNNTTIYKIELKYTINISV